MQRHLAGLTYIASFPIGGVLIYKLCPGQGSGDQLGPGGGQCLRTQAEGWGRLRCSKWAALGRLPGGGDSWRSQSACHGQRSKWEVRTTGNHHQVSVS